jgi:protein-S-isoprenylcysteine O-methyltransferase Ste14
MADRESRLLDDAKRELGQLGDDLKELVLLRRRLALLEFRTATRQVKRLAIVLTVAAVVALSSLPVLLVYLAEILAGVWMSRVGWLLSLGLGLLSVALLGGWLAVRRFRREFVGMEETLEEFREDLVWLEEWAGKREQGGEH